MAKDAPLKKKSVNLSGRRFLLRLGNIRMEPALLRDDVMDCDMVLFLVVGVLSGSTPFPLTSSFILLSFKRGDSSDLKVHAGSC